jgi:UDP-N-acetylmuramoyl-tripeptide--D-alanyl-D-alanine ligase
LLTVGPMSRLTAAAARQAGLREVEEFADAAAAAVALRGLMRPGDMVLLKASRVMGLEQVRVALEKPGAAERQDRPEPRRVGENGTWASSVGNHAMN